MNIHALTDKVVHSLAMDFRRGSDGWTTNTSGAYAAVLLDAVDFMGMYQNTGSTILPDFVGRGLPHGNPSSQMPCRFLYSPRGSDAYDVAGRSAGAPAAMACFARAIHLATETFSDADITGWIFPVVAATGELQGGTIQPVDKLSDKLAVFRTWEVANADLTRTVLAAPAANRVVVDALVAEHGIQAHVEYLRDLSDCFTLVVRLFADFVERFQRATDETRDITDTFDWRRVKHAQWWPNRNFASDAATYLLVPGQRAVGPVNLDALGVLERAWSNRDAPLNRSSKPGVLFDEALLRYAACRFVLTTLIADERSRIPVEPDTPKPGPGSAAPLLDQFTRGVTSTWTEEQWLALANEALAHPDLLASDAHRTLARLIVSALQLLDVSDEQFDQVRALIATDTPAAEPLQQPSLAWDASSLMRLDPKIDPTNPIVHVWVTGPDDAIEQVLIVGRGNGLVRQEIEGIVTSIALQSSDPGRHEIRSGVVVLRSRGDDLPLLTDLPARLVALRGAFAASGAAAAASPSQELHFAVEELRKLAEGTGLVQIHAGTSAEDLDRLRDALSPLARPSAGIEVLPVQLDVEAATVAPLGWGRQPAAVGVPPSLFTNTEFADLVRACEARILERVDTFLNRRVKFYSQIERECEARVDWWNRQTQAVRDAHHDVIVSVEVDLERQIEKPVPPRKESARVQYEQKAPKLGRSAAVYRTRMQRLKDGITHASVRALPALVAQRFCDAVIRGVAPDDVLVDCPPEIADAYRRWAGEAAPLLRALILDWCDRHGLARIEDRQRVLTRHLSWRLVGYPDRTALVPTVVAHSRESLVIQDAARHLRWVVHPLDGARNVTIDSDERTSRREGAARLVREALAAADRGDPSAPASILRARELDVVETFRLLLDEGSSKAGARRETREHLTDAKLRMLPIRALLHANSPVEFSAYSELEALLLDPLRAGDRVASVRAPETFDDWEKIPELPLLLAASYLPHVASDAMLARVHDSLRALARLWDAKFFEQIDKAANKSEWSTSDRALAGRRWELLTPEQREAYAAFRARQLYSLASEISVALDRIDWSGDTIRQVYLHVGKLADDFVDRFPTELGGREARDLLNSLVLFEREGRDAK